MQSLIVTVLSHRRSSVTRFAALIRRSLRIRSLRSATAEYSLSPFFALLNTGSLPFPIRWPCSLCGIVLDRTDEPSPTFQIKVFRCLLWKRNSKRKELCVGRYQGKGGCGAIDASLLSVTF